MVKTSIEVLAVGRCGVDLYPFEEGKPIEEITQFGKFLGGSAANVSVGASRLGSKASILTGVGADPFGRFVINELGRLGVDTSNVITNEQFNTPITFCELFPPDNFPLYFYRQPTTPDLQIGEANLPSNISDIKVLWLTVSGLSSASSKDAHYGALKRRGSDLINILDLDYRPRFWASERVAHDEANAIIEQMDVVVGNREEWQIATGETDPLCAANNFLDKGVKLAIVKQGLKGTIAFSKDKIVDMPLIPVPIRNGLGAGDAFGGAICHGLIQGWVLEKIVAFASAAGAIVASRLECANAMPTVSEVEELLASRADIQPQVTKK